MKTFYIFEVSKQTDMNTLKYNKRTEVKFETARDFLTANKTLVLSVLKTSFCFEVYDMKTLATDYFTYVQNSKYVKNFTLVYEKKQVAKAIEYSVQNFKRQYKALSIDHAAINDFTEERRKAAFETKSF